MLMDKKQQQKSSSNAKDGYSKGSLEDKQQQQQRSSSPDLVSQAYRNMVMGKSFESLSKISQKVRN